MPSCLSLTCCLRLMRMRNATLEFWHLCPNPQFCCCGHVTQKAKLWKFKFWTFGEERVRPEVTG